MFCTNCGKFNSDDAVYCQKCGKLLEAEDETIVAIRDRRAARPIGDNVPGHNAAVVTVRPTLKFVQLGYVLAVVSAIVLAILISSAASVSPWVPVVIGLAFLLVPAFYHIRQRLVSYTLTPSTIEIARGVAVRTTQNVPLRQIRDVTISASLAQRLFGFGDVIIDNSGGDGERVVLRNIDAPRRFADELLRQLGHVDS